ncbi:MAG: hypothetical protein QM759_07035 [Terricaulis sp.]
MRPSLVCFVLTLAISATASAEPTDPLERAAEAYASFETDISAITAAQVSDADTMDGVLTSAARHDPADLSRGWIAYAALAATQSPTFVRGVQARVRAAGRAPVLRQLMRDATYARRRPGGSAEAIGMVLATMSADAARLTAAADRYDRLSDQLQLNAPFASPDDAHRADRDQRLRITNPPALPTAIAARLHVAPAAAPLTDATAFGSAHFWDTLAGLAPVNATPMHARADRQAFTDRVLTLAGLSIVGATTQSNARIDALLDDASSRDCLHVQQLEFRQCASVSHTPDEDAACLARHGLRGVAACLSF